MTDWMHHGLNLSEPDVNPSDQWEAWREHERNTRGYPLPTWDLFADIRPDAVKRWLVQQQTSNAVEGGFRTALSFVNYYAIVGFEAGELYCIDIVEKQGMSRADVADALTVAFLNSPSMGMHYLAPAVGERLKRYVDPEKPYPWPEGWGHDPEAFKAGLDYSTPDALPGEVDLIRTWYRDVTGEVPRYVDFLGEWNPKVLKAYRNRFETALTSLPNQMLPYMLLSLEAVRGSHDGLRDAVLLARGFGMTRAQTVSAVMPSMLYASHVGLEHFDRTAGDILANW